MTIHFAGYEAESLWRSAGSLLLALGKRNVSLEDYQNETYEQGGV